MWFFFLEKRFNHHKSLSCMQVKQRSEDPDCFLEEGEL